MKILLIGNSHTYYNLMPSYILKLLRATGEKCHITMVTQGGKGLDFQANNPASVFNIKYGEYDMVIAQDRATNFDPKSFWQGAETLLKLSRESGAAFYLYMPWAGRDRREEQYPMTEAYHSFCRAHNCRFAPAGETFSRLLQTESPDTLYIEDGNHATVAGSYAAAVTIFYTITGRKRVLKPELIEDPGIAAGLSLEYCKKVHTEACTVTHLYNG